jgi:hypothetical protein
VTTCVLCGEARDLDGSGLCRNSSNPDDYRPRFNACADLIGHLGHRLTRSGRARLRTKARSPEAATRLLQFAAREAGVAVTLEVGESWVLATSTGESPTGDRAVAMPRRVVDGFVVDDLDIAKMHLDLIEAKRKASLYQEMAQVEDGWQEAAVEAHAQAARLTKLIEAWEDEHGQR